MMATTAVDFVGELEHSGICRFRLNEVARLVSHCETAESAANLLVDQKLLTKFQASILTGEAQWRCPLSIGEYEVCDLIGRGGMGFVVRARHRTMKRDVAIKFLRNSEDTNAEWIQRFDREVEAAAQLQHPNIVAAYDAGITGTGSRYLVMQYVHGVDLLNLVRSRGPMTLARCYHLIQQAAEGLHYAHKNGIVHRDVKPSNLLVTEDEQLYILDMGLARLILKPDGLMESPDDQQLTSDGAMLGTVDYMSPEQALDAKKADHRSDIYSLGCTLYFLLTGNPPYSGNSVMARLLAHQERPAPSLLGFRPDAPKELDILFRKMIEKDPRKRIPDMAAVLSELQNLPRTSGSKNLDALQTIDSASLSEECVETLNSALKAKPDVHGESALGLESIDISRFDSASNEVSPNVKSVVVTTHQVAEIYSERSISPIQQSPKPILKTKQRRWVSLLLGCGALAGGGYFWKAQHSSTPPVIEEPKPISTTRYDSENYYGTDLVEPTKQTEQTGISSVAIQETATSSDPPKEQRVITFIGNSPEPPPIPEPRTAVEGTVVATLPLMEATAKTGAVTQTVTSNEPLEPLFTEPDNEWSSLFNGRNLAGWEVKGAEGWRVDDQVLIGEADDKNALGWLMTKRVLENFELQLEYQLDPMATSGVFLRAWPDGHLSGMQFMKIQLTDEVAAAESQLTKSERTGALYDKFPVASFAEAPTGEWNHLSVKLKGQRLGVAINSKAVLETDSFPRKNPGPLGLQLDHHKVQFRNIKIKILKEDADAGRDLKRAADEKN